MLGASIEGPEPREFNGLQVELWPRVSWSPFFALTFADIKVFFFGCLQLLSRGPFMLVIPSRKTEHCILVIFIVFIGMLSSAVVVGPLLL